MSYSLLSFQNLGNTLLNGNTCLNKLFLKYIGGEGWTANAAWSSIGNYYCHDKNFKNRNHIFYVKSSSPKQEQKKNTQVNISYVLQNVTEMSHKLEILSWSFTSSLLWIQPPYNHKLICTKHPLYLNNWKMLLACHSGNYIYHRSQNNITVEANQRHHIGLGKILAL